MEVNFCNCFTISLIVDDKLVLVLDSFLTSLSRRSICDSSSLNISVGFGEDEYVRTGLGWIILVGWINLVDRKSLVVWIMFDSILDVNGVNGVDIIIQFR